LFFLILLLKIIVLLCCFHDFVGLLEHILEVKQKFRRNAHIAVIITIVKQIIASTTIPKNVIACIIATVITTVAEYVITSTAITKNVIAITIVIVIRKCITGWTLIAAKYIISTTTTWIIVVKHIGATLSVWSEDISWIIIVIAVITTIAIAVTIIIIVSITIIAAVATAVAIASTAIVGILAEDVSTHIVRWVICEDVATCLIIASVASRTGIVGITSGTFYGIDVQGSLLTYGW